MNLRSSLRSYWFWFYLIITLYSVYDFFKHIQYDNVLYFREHWVQWLIFTICCTASVCFCIYAFNLLLKRVLKKETLISQSIAIILAVILYMYVIGRVFDILIFGHQTLIFRFNLPVLLIVLGLFYFMRAILFLIEISTKKMR